MGRLWFAIATYYLISLAISWGYWFALLMRGEVVAEGSPTTHLPGLMGPLIGAFIAAWLAGGRRAVVDLAVRCVRIPRRWLSALLIVAAPPAVAAVVIGVRATTGTPPPPPDAFLAYPGAGAMTLPALMGIVVLNGFGEEAGWRGFALERLSPAFGPFAATLVVATLWAVWHLPLFWLNQSMAALAGPMLVGWVVGLVLGAFALSWLYLAFDRSVLLLAVWHVGYNFSVATPGTAGFVAALVTSLVMVWGIWAAWRLLHPPYSKPLPTHNSGG